jgi:hypothetical protein
MAPFHQQGASSDDRFSPFSGRPVNGHILSERHIVPDADEGLLTGEAVILRRPPQHRVLENPAVFADLDAAADVHKSFDANAVAYFGAVVHYRIRTYLDALPQLG